MVSNRRMILLLVKGKFFLMRSFVVIVALSSIFLLTDCGRLKVAKDEPETVEARPVIITQQNALDDQAADSEMFTRKSEQLKPMVTSKPMFTVKKRPDRKDVAWFKDYIKALPEGYHGKPNQLVIKPPPEDTVLISSKSEWDDKPAAEPVKEKVYEPVQYPDLTVFPVDGDDAPYRAADAQDAPKDEAGKEDSKFEYINDGDAVQGELVDELYFAHGSASISQADLNGLYDLSADVADLGEGIHISVVGHASERVDNVNDPAMKDKINTKMSERRA